MKTRMILRVPVLFTILTAVWACGDREAELGQANAAQGDSRVQLQGAQREVASARVESIDEISFAVPDNWRYVRKLGTDYAILAVKNKPEFCEIEVVRPFRSTGNKEQDFAIAWKRVIDIYHTRRDPSWVEHESTSRSGYSGTYGHSTTGNGYFVALFVLTANGKAIPIIIVTSTDNVWDNVVQAVNVFVDNVRVAPDKAQPLKSNITLADLVGRWSSNSASAINKPNVRGGTNTTLIATGSGYTINQDGSYTLVEVGGINGSYSKTQAAGRIEFVNDQIIFRERGNNSANRYWAISYETDPTGSTLLTLLPAQYPPRRGNSIYYEVFVRRSGMK